MNEPFSELNTVGLKTKAVKSAGINVTAQSIGFVCNMVGAVVLARLLTPKDFGLVAMVTAFSLLPMNFGVNGFVEYIIQKESISAKEINAIFWVHGYVSTFMALCFAAFGVFLVDFYREPALGGIAAAMATTFILVAVCTSHRALLRREMKYGSIATGDLMAILVSNLLSIVAALGGVTYWAVVTRQLALRAVTAIVAWILCPWRPGRPRNLSLAIPGLKYAVKVYCNFSIRYVTRSTDRVLLGKFHGSAVLGNYDRAYHLSSFPAGQFLAPLHSIALAVLSRLRNDEDRYRLYYTKAVSMVSFLGTIAALVLTLTAKDLILLLLGPAWSQAGLVVMAFGPGIAAMLLYETHHWLHLSLGTPGRWLRWSLFATLVTVTAFVIAAPFGAVAMAIAYSATMYILTIPGLWYAGRPIQLSIASVVRSIWAYFASGSCVFMGWLLLSAYWAAFGSLLMEISPLNRVVVTMGIVTFLYVAMVIILQKSFSSIRECISLLRVMLSRRGS